MSPPGWVANPRPKIWDATKELVFEFYGFQFFVALSEPDEPENFGSYKLGASKDWVIPFLDRKWPDFDDKLKDAITTPPDPWAGLRKRFAKINGTELSL